MPNARTYTQVGSSAGLLGTFIPRQPRSVSPQVMLTSYWIKYARGIQIMRNTNTLLLFLGQRNTRGLSGFPSSMPPGRQPIRMTFLTNSTQPTKSTPNRERLPGRRVELGSCHCRLCRFQCLDSQIRNALWNEDVKTQGTLIAQMRVIQMACP